MFLVFQPWTLHTVCISLRSRVDPSESARIATEALTVDIANKDRYRHTAYIVSCPMHLVEHPRIVTDVVRLHCEQENVVAAILASSAAFRASTQILHKGDLRLCFN